MSEALFVSFTNSGRGPSHFSRLSPSRFVGTNPKSVFKVPRFGSQVLFVETYVRFISSLFMFILWFCYGGYEGGGLLCTSLKSKYDPES